ncbi:MAG: hypothetical protein M1404_07055 [Acidobacteria bacterium]|nr:hypothetical protein [Acidobacteriota bacterium]
MIPDELREQEDMPESRSERTRLGGKFTAVFVVLVVLAVGEIFSLIRVHFLRNDFRAQEAQTRKQLTDWVNRDVSARLSSLERSNSEQLEALKIELNEVSRHLGSQRGELRQARMMVTKLQNEHSQQLDELKHEIDLKADQQQLGALTNDVSATKTDLGKTKQNVDSLANSLGMTRTRFGTLIARNHDEIVALRKLGERDYFEFTASRHKPIRVGKVGLELKKTNAKHHRFNVDMLVDDAWLEKKNRTINEPIFFTMRGSRSFSELVVNRVDKGRITGYISTPKGTTQTASRLEGTR